MSSSAWGAMSISRTKARSSLTAIASTWRGGALVKEEAAIAAGQLVRQALLTREALFQLLEKTLGARGRSIIRLPTIFKESTVRTVFLSLLSLTTQKRIWLLIPLGKSILLGMGTSNQLSLLYKTEIRMFKRKGSNVGRSSTYLLKAGKETLSRRWKMSRGSPKA